MNYKVISAAVLFALAAAALPAHHAVQSVFDFNKPVTVKGTVTRVEFINPHSYVSVEKTDASGKAEIWTFETLALGTLRKRGLSRSDKGGLKLGDEITITGFAAHDGTKFAFMETLKLPDGRVLNVGTRDPNGL